MITWSLRSRVAWWNPGEAGINEPIAELRNVGPYGLGQNTVPFGSRLRLTGSLICVDGVIIPGLTDAAVPVPNSAVRADAEFIVQRDLITRDVRCVSEIQAAVHWKFNVDDLFQLFAGALYASHLLAYAHVRPLLIQRNPLGVFHDDVLGADCIGGIVALVQYLRNANASLCLYWDGKSMVSRWSYILSFLRRKTYGTQQSKPLNWSQACKCKR